ncbi:hypothetical protein LJB90_01870 [Eubacteriales bacterium OttesenSCG-928-G02]|nr:hypothetical protein [Eubacteriales bacterium OttesenSCG-928-G02]
MTNKTLSQAVREFKEYQLLKEEAEAKLEELKAAIVAEMNGADEIIVDTFKVRNQRIKSNRLDSKSLKSELPEIADRYMIEAEYNRFAIA